MEASVPSAPPTFEHAMLPHLDAAYNLARWLLRDPHDAEDAVQEACVRAYRAIDRFRGGDGRPWLLTIVRNVCYSHLRKNRAEPPPAPFDDEAHGSTWDPAEANAVAWRELKSELLRQGLERLPAEYREVIVLHELEGLSYREIAAVAAVPVGTVMSRLSRARGRLQTELLALSGKEASHGL
jgi:RNA polymerase sigma-70 factor (ECF subfamily)